MRIGTMLYMPGEPLGTHDLVRRAVENERLGLDAAWLPQVGSIDALTVLALAGQQTTRIELGTAVIPTYPRHPSALAVQALTVQEATGGRLALGIGLSHKFLIENSLGLDYSRPIPHTREYLTVLNGLLAGDQVSFQGEEYRVNLRLADAANRTPPPVLVAALGPAMLRLCGRLSAGTITWMGGLDYLRNIAVPTMSEAAAKAGRPAPRFVVAVPLLLTGDPPAARETIAAKYAMYGQIPSYRATLDRGGAAGPADVALVGDEEALAAGLSEYEAAGTTDFVGVIPSGAPEEAATLDFLATYASRKS